MIAEPNPTRALLTDDALIETLCPIGRDYLATIVLTGDFPNAERHAALRARQDAYITALSDALTAAVEAAVWRVRGTKPGGRL